MEALAIILLAGISIETRSDDATEHLIIADSNSPRTENSQKTRQRDKINNFLDMARDSMLAKRYRNPIGYNALAQYRAVLKIDSGNKKANQGIFKIAEHYNSLAIQAKYNKNQQQENKFLKIVKSIYPVPKDFEKFKRTLENIKKSDLRLQEIRTLSLKVKRNLMAKRYIQPKKDNVLFYSRQILEIDPDNKRARSGIQNLLDHFFIKIQKSEKSNKIDAVNKYLNILISISPDSKKVQSIKQRLFKAETDRQKKEQIKRLLLKAKKNIDSENYSTPKNNNAIAQLFSILKLDSDNLEAKTGIQTISERYLVLTQKSIKKGQLENAEKFIKMANFLSPNSDSVRQVRQTLNNQLQQVKTEADNKINNNVKLKTDKIKRLLRLAKQDLAADRLALPKGKNALHRYTQVLKLDRRNKLAKEGMKNIQAKYITLASQAISLQQFEKANKLIKTADSILSNSQSVLTISQKLKDAIKKKQRDLELKKQNAVLTKKNIIGKWCNIDFSIEISQNQWIYHLQDDDIIYSISQFNFSKEQISIFWTDKKGGAMVTEFKVKAKDNGSRIVQHRGKPISSNKWFDYNREFTSCR